MKMPPYPRGGTPHALAKPRGFVGWIVLWLMGIPAPVLLGLFLVRGCA